MARRSKERQIETVGPAIGLWRVVEGGYEDTESVGWRCRLGGWLEVLDCECGHRSHESDWDLEVTIDGVHAHCPKCGARYSETQDPSKAQVGREAQCCEVPSHAIDEACENSQAVEEPPEPSFHGLPRGEARETPEEIEAWIRASSSKGSKSQPVSEPTQPAEHDEIVTSDGEVVKHDNLGEVERERVRILQDEVIDLYLKIEILAQQKKAFISQNKADVEDARERIGQLREEVQNIKAGKTAEQAADEAANTAELKQLGLFGGAK